MVHLTYLSLLLATLCNALLMSLCRANEPVYHLFEVLTIALYMLFGGLVVYSMPKSGILKHFGYWFLQLIMLRFSLYSAVWGYVAYKDPLYLGDGAWTDRLIKTVLFDWMNQSSGALGYLYIIVGIWSFLLYLRLILNKS